MMRNTLLGAVLVSVVAVAPLAPQSAWAGGADKYRQCLSDGADAPDETRARSECMWKHWAYMASYGR